MKFVAQIGELGPRIAAYEYQVGMMRNYLIQHRIPSHHEKAVEGYLLQIERAFHPASPSTTLGASSPMQSHNNGIVETEISKIFLREIEPYYSPAVLDELRIKVNDRIRAQKGRINVAKIVAEAWRELKEDLEKF